MLRRCSGAIFSKGCSRYAGSTQRRGRWLTTRSPSPPFKNSWRMHSTSVHALKKKSVTNGGGETLPIPLAYWPKPKHCYSTTAPNSSPNRGDYCRSKRHESASARFDANRHPRNGAESRPYSRSRSRARTGADTDQSAGQGARKGNSTGVIRCIFLGSGPRHGPRLSACLIKKLAPSEWAKQVPFELNCGLELGNKL